MSWILAARVFVPFAIGYLCVSIFRSINAVIASDLVRDLDLSASGLGFAISAFFLSATIFQLPCGVLLDKYDPRRVYAVLLCVCAFGAVIIALAENFQLLALGRALVALGVASSAVASYKVYATWFSQERLPLVNGLSLAAGGIGLMLGTVPVEAALEIVDWRTIHLLVGGALIVVAVFVLLVAPERNSESVGLTVFGQIAGLKVITGSMVFWRAAPLMMAVVGIFACMTQLWVGPWVRDVAGLSAKQAANLLLVLAAAMTLAGFATGALTNLAKRLGFDAMQFAAITAGLFAILLVPIFLQWTPSILMVFCFWAMFGFLASLNFVTYAALAPHFPPQMIGRLNACLTLSWMLGAFLFQSLYGVVLDWFPTTDTGYSIVGHQYAMGILLVILLLAIGWFIVSSRLLQQHTKAEC